ncbi:MAG TPA: ABC transporter ATP-binding protein [Polyangiales bacterium]|nr:ABC transporter ATP-binding protein [Polyangiales bacterium]
MTLLEVRDLHTRFETSTGPLRPVDGVSFELSAGGTLGVVGESGSGKTMTALSILRLLPGGAGRIESGQINFDGKDLLALPEREMRGLRGKRIAMVFQEPMTSLNPVYSVARQIGEVLRLHEGMSRRDARARSIELLRVVGIPDPERRVDSYPHELSGGMRQRVMIAMAIACRPQLLIADEPTTALDVTIQAQILELLARLRQELGMAVLLITHDLGVVAEFAEEVLVMYAGTVVERAPAAALFAAPQHPYTQGLLASAPSRQAGRKRLATIAGVVPDLAHLPGGCRFRERCVRAVARCAESEPPLLDSGEGRKVACFVAMAELTGHMP